ncbi:hypothetical protein DFJ77DRAFT_459698 [Powellomyces hirtus]|nr:hypothetical protein DFJ77DRAFT_459698 [Powellomyces hirtus]
MGATTSSRSNHHQIPTSTTTTPPTTIPTAAPTTTNNRVVSSFPLSPSTTYPPTPANSNKWLDFGPVFIVRRHTTETAATAAAAFASPSAGAQPSATATDARISPAAEHVGTASTVTGTTTTAPLDAGDGVSEDDASGDEAEESENEQVDVGEQVMTDEMAEAVECCYDTSPPPHNPTTLHARLQIHRSSVTYKPATACTPHPSLTFCVDTLAPCTADIMVAGTLVRSVALAAAMGQVVTVEPCPMGKCCVQVVEKAARGGNPQKAWFVCALGEGGVGKLRQGATINGIKFHLQEIYGAATSPIASTATTSSGQDCPICLSDPRCVLVLPCRHLCLCRACAEAVRVQGRAGAAVAAGVPRCPICRAVVQSLLHIRTPHDEPDVKDNNNSDIPRTPIPHPTTLPLLPAHPPSDSSTSSSVSSLNLTRSAAPAPSAPPLSPQPQPYRYHDYEYDPVSAPRRKSYHSVVVEPEQGEDGSGGVPGSVLSSVQSGVAGGASCEWVV